MAYAETPHIEVNLDAVGTGTPYKVNWVNDVCGVMIAAGWEAEVKLETNTNDPGGPYNRTIAPTIILVSQTGEFDSFSLFASPPGDSCDGLGAWSVIPTTGGLSIGTDTDLGPYSEVRNCCVCDGACDAGSKYGTSSTTECNLDCVDGGAGLCVSQETWSWSPGDISGQHNALIGQIVKHTEGCTGPKKSLTISQTITASSAESWIAVWCEGGSTAPLVGPVDLDFPGVGAAFNTTLESFHGGWVLHSQPSNTDENVMTVYIGVNRASEGPGDIVAATYPFLHSFSTYTAQTHPVQYTNISALGSLAGQANRTLFRNDANDMRLIANPHQAIMYGHIDGTAISTGSSNDFMVGAIRTVPINGEDPNDPASWSFKRAIYHVGGAGVGIHRQNWFNPNNTSWYMTIDTGAGTDSASHVEDSKQLSVSGWNWYDRVKINEPPCKWISGEAFYCEPWTGFDSGTFTADRNAPILGQLWDAIMPSVTGNGTVSGSGQGGYFFWDGQWWRHWQDLRTDITSEGGPQGNLAFRVGFQSLEGAEPINGTWIGLPDPRDVFLYDLLQDNTIEALPWGNMTGLSISNGTFSGGTTTRTLTATCTEHPDALGDGDKLVALHSPRNYFTFVPEVITIASGTTTGTSLVSALSPGLGGVDATIYADSITQVSLAVRVED